MKQHAATFISATLVFSLGTPAWCAEAEYDKKIDFPLLKIQQQHARQALKSKQTIESTDHIFDALVELNTIDDEESRLRAAIDAALLLKKRTQAIIQKKRSTESTYQKVIRQLFNINNIFNGASGISQKTAKRQTQQVRAIKYEKMREYELVITKNTKRFIENQEALLAERQVIDELMKTYLADAVRNNTQSFLKQLERTFYNLQHHLTATGNLVDILIIVREERAAEPIFKSRDDIIRLVANVADNHKSVDL